MEKHWWNDFEDPASPCVFQKWKFSDAKENILSSIY